MTRPQLRFGIIGAGLIGREHVVRIKNEPLCTAVAIADPTSDAASYAAHQQLAYYDDYRAMIAAEALDAVVIATPNSTHAPIGIACARRGLHILVEKPIADTMEAAWALVAAARLANVVTLVGHHRRHGFAIAKAREIVQGGTLGRLTAVSALWLVQKPDDYFGVRWRSEEGGGPVLINLIHDIDDLRFICGDIDTVQALTSNATRGFVVEDSAAICIRFVNGALGTITMSDNAAAPWSWEMTSGENPAYPRCRENCYLFSGTNGSLAIPKMELWRYGETKGWHAPLQCERLAGEEYDPLARQIRHFCRVIHGTESTLITAADGARTLATTLAVLAAAGSGARIHVKAFDIDD